MNRSFRYRKKKLTGLFIPRIVFHATLRFHPILFHATGIVDIDALYGSGDLPRISTIGALKSTFSIVASDTMAFTASNNVFIAADRAMISSACNQTI